MSGALRTHPSTARSEKRHDLRPLPTMLASAAHQAENVLAAPGAGCEQRRWSCLAGDEREPVGEGISGNTGWAAVISVMPPSIRWSVNSENAATAEPLGPWSRVNEPRPAGPSSQSRYDESRISGHATTHFRFRGPARRPRPQRAALALRRFGASSGLSARMSLRHQPSTAPRGSEDAPCFARSRGRLR